MVVLVGGRDSIVLTRCDPRLELDVAAAETCGCETVVASLLSLGVRHIFAVAGQPITHIAELAAALHPGFEWSVNEKVAIESALGLSAVGVRSVVLIKQCGLNVALDSLTNAVCHTTSGALLIVVGDDVGATSSTCEQDSRELAKVARVPVVEPRNGLDISPAFNLAVSIGEAAATPVLIRLVNDVHTKFTPGAVIEGPDVAPLGALDHGVAFSLTKLGRQQHHRTVTWPRVQAVIDGHATVDTACGPTCTAGVLSVGATAHDGQGDDPERCWATTSVSWPLPTRVQSFARAHADLLVLEAPGPFVERELALVTVHESPVGIRGRLTGHLPPEGPLGAEVIDAADRPTAVASTWSSIARKPTNAPVATPPYDRLFRAVARARRSGVFVAADVGSAVKLCYPPFEGADVSLSLGSAISVASGAARTGCPSIAVIGDFALLHSGLEALVDAARHALRVTVLVLLNGIQEQTGGQPSGTIASVGALPAVSLAELAIATGSRLVADISLDDYDEDALHDLLVGWLPKPGTSVALVREGAGRLLPAHPSRHPNRSRALQAHA